MVEDLKKQVDSMKKLLDASRSIATLDPMQATENIVAETVRILLCDRATIFIIDEARQELVLCVAEGATNIRLPIGQGIAGTVASTGETININDAYTDPRFSAASDKATGYKTTTILCMPIRGPDNKIVGVLQAINKKVGPVFTNDDEDVMAMLATQVFRYCHLLCVFITVIN